MSNDTNQQTLDALSRALEIADLALERAEHADSAKGRFLAQMSHEVRTPLNSILGLTELVLATELSDQQRQYLEMIRDSGRHLLTVLNQVLSFSKLEKGHLELEQATFDLPALLREVIAPYQPQLAQRGVGCELLLPPDLPREWRGDPARLRQILVNLLDNAAKFTSQGRITLGAEMIAEDGHPFLHCAVGDSGIGIAADRAREIFAPFAQADGSVSRRFGGTGLGLTICRQLVGLMGGRIWVESAEGKGSTFHFTILRLPPVSEPQASLPVAGIHILVADDDYVNRLVTGEMLKNQGWRVTLAADGEEVIARLAEDKIDLLLLDMQMPGMDGYQAAAAIRARERESGGRRLPVIAMTGLDSEEDLARIRAAGIDGHLLKPFNRDALVAAVFRHLAIHP